MDSRFDELTSKCLDNVVSVKCSICKQRHMMNYNQRTFFLREGHCGCLVGQVPRAKPSTAFVPRTSSCKNCLVPFVQKNARHAFCSASCREVFATKQAK